MKLYDAGKAPTPRRVRIFFAEKGLPLPELVPHAHELKVVIFNKSDFDWAEQYAALVSPQCKLFLQPEWDKAAQVTPLIIEYIKANPQWELSLQIHKYINVP